MIILRNELKKIWNPAILVLIVLICALFYQLFLHYYIRYFSNGHPPTEEYNYSVELTGKYGPTLESGEFQEFMKVKSDLIAEADKYIKSETVFTEAGILNYEDYQKLANRSMSGWTDKEQAAFSYLCNNCNNIGYKLDRINFIKSAYQDAEQQYRNRILEIDSEAERLRLNEIIETGQYRSILDYELIENASAYISWFAVLVMLSVLLFLSPLLVTDHMRNVHLMQYTSRHGRSLLFSQLAAVLISAFLLTTFEILVFGTFYAVKGTQVFWNNGLDSFLEWYTFRFFITYGRYISYSVVMLYLCAIGAAFIAFTLSKLSRNYITLLLMIIPAFILLANFCLAVFNVSFSFENPLYKLTGIAGVEPLSCCAVALFGMILCLLVCTREKKSNIQ